MNETASDRVPERTRPIRPFEILNPEAAGGLVLVCDHASNNVPPEFDNLGLPPAMLDRHIGWDIGAADVTRRLAARLGVPAVLSATSRLVIDPNRPLGHPESILPESDGVIVPGNRLVSEVEAERRAALYFHPYQEAVAATIAGARRRGLVPAVVAIHSFVPEMAGFRRPWDVGLLHAEDRRLSDALMAALAANEPDLVIGDNEPYSGMSESRHTLREHAEKPGYPYVLIEIRQDLVGDDAGAERWAARLAEVIPGVLEYPDLRGIRQEEGESS